MADPLQQLQHRLLAFTMQFEQGIVPGHHQQFGVILQQDALAGLGGLGRTHMGQQAMGVGDPLHQDLQLAAGFLAAEQARGDHPGVVEHQQVAGLEEIG